MPSAEDVKEETNAMMRLVKHNVGTAGLEYVNYCLQQGEGLCSELISALDLDKGHVYAVAPIEIERARLTEFLVGGLMSRKSSKSWLAGHIKERALSKQFTIILQDIWARSSDPFLQNINLNILSSRDGNVYYIMNNSFITEEILGHYIDDLSSYVFVCVLSAYILPYAASQGNFDANHIKHIAAHTFEIFVPAFDQEGLIMWER